MFFANQSAEIRAAHADGPVIQVGKLSLDLGRRRFTLHGWAGTVNSAGNLSRNAMVQRLVGDGRYQSNSRAGTGKRLANGCKNS
jgi:hypothetical protein